MPEFLGEIASQTNEWLKHFGAPKEIGPSPAFDCDYVAVGAHLKGLDPKKFKRALIDRCQVAVDYFEARSVGRPLAISGAKLAENVLGSSWPKIKSRLLRNSYRGDLYFLPPDAQDPSWSAVPVHSVALLRYLITVPTYFLDEAHASDERDWEGRRTTLINKPLHWCSGTDKKYPPLRTLRLRDAFLSDLLTKVVGIYVRLGAPDLETVILDRIEKEIV